MPPAAVAAADAESVPEQLARVLRRYRQAMGEALADGGYRPLMPAANWLLIALARQPGTVNDLARRLGLTKQAVSRLTDRLVVLGYCDRQRSQANRRQVRLSVTEAGARAADALQAGIQEADKALLGSLGGDERAAFRHALSVMAAVAPSPDAGSPGEGPPGEGSPGEGPPDAADAEEAD
jgi:DNA-binding MarR family transcriptional regulator